MSLLRGSRGQTQAWLGNRGGSTFILVPVPLAGISWCQGPMNMSSFQFRQTVSYDEVPTRFLHGWSA